MFLIIDPFAGDPSSKYTRMRPLAYRPLGNWLPCASKWLNECLEEHELCSSETITDIRPTRVIDVGPSDGSQQPFLHISGEEVRTWVALSHCWGQNQPLRTTLSSFPNPRRALPMDHLPNLFRDAVTVTRCLKYRYLWIDSLCIIQDSREDRNREILNMGNIYKYGIFTISAENCRDSREPILENHIPDETECVNKGSTVYVKDFKE